MLIPSNGITEEEKKGSAAVRDGDRRTKVFHVANSTDQGLRETMGQGVGLRKRGESRSTRKAEGHDFDKTAIGELRNELPQLGSPAQELKRVDSAQVPDSADKDRECDASDQLSAVEPQQNSLLPAVSDCFCPASPTSGSLIGDDPMLEMSCEAAASIISSMRGDSSREQARLQLGCKSREYCNVKNMKVLQVMDMD